LFDPCFNVRMGAWVLATKIQRHGATWEAVGSYNARSREKRDIYIHKVWSAYRSS
jgi:soluble lytic murein transglycosylase-like protein